MNNSYYKFGSTKNPYGLKDDQLVFVDDVKNGLNCGCVCPTCKVNLIAKQGEVREHHFAHQCDDNSCLHIQDTYFRLTKEILENKRCIRVPASPSNQVNLVSIQEVQTKIISEDKGILPDLVVTTSEGRQITIRFKPKKGLLFYESMNNEYLELDASNIKLNQLEDFLVNNQTNKKWVNSRSSYRHRRSRRHTVRNESFESSFDITTKEIEDAIYSSNFELDNTIQNIDLSALRNDNDYLNSGTRQQQRIKMLLRNKELLGQSKSKCADCVHSKNDMCSFLIEKFYENNQEYVLCSNNKLYMQKYHQDNYFNFKPLPKFDPLEQYEAKIWIDKHFTRNTIIDNFARINNHIVILHTNNKQFYVTNVSYQNNNFHFSHEKIFDKYVEAEQYYKWVKNLKM